MHDGVAARRCCAPSCASLACEAYETCGAAQRCVFTSAGGARAEGRALIVCGAMSGLLLYFIVRMWSPASRMPLENRRIRLCRRRVRRNHGWPQHAVRCRARCNRARNCCPACDPPAFVRGRHHGERPGARVAGAHAVLWPATRGTNHDLSCWARCMSGDLERLSGRTSHSARRFRGALAASPTLALELSPDDLLVLAGRRLTKYGVCSAMACLPAICLRSVVAQARPASARQPGRAG